MLEIVIILQLFTSLGISLVPCPTYGLQVPYVDRHQGTQLCCCIVEHQTRQQQVQANLTANHTVFTIGDTPIDQVTSFKYLGRVLSANDDDLSAVILNL